MRSAPEVTSPVSLCHPATSEADVGGMTVKVEPSHQYSVTFCCRVIDGSRGPIRLDGIRHGSAYGANGQK